MFWNKQSTGNDEPIVKKNYGVDYNQEFDRIDEFHDEFAKRGDFFKIKYSDIDEYYSPVRGSNDKILRRYNSVVRQNTENKKLNEEMSAVLEGNKEWYGYSQETIKKNKQHIEDLKLHLELEKNNFLELYKKNRELESEVYLLKRELELIGRGWKSELKNDTPSN